MTGNNGGLWGAPALPPVIVRARGIEGSPPMRAGGRSYMNKFASLFNFSNTHTRANMREMTREAPVSGPLDLLITVRGVREQGRPLVPPMLPPPLLGQGGNPLQRSLLHGGQVDL
eukprot:TRINITY_DN16333_c0_g1_i4.p1 TRINITY_DN16333_c0_g1~~TRINITY_DN16333_c0_g1_i4.p1  ORF type:complete len:122 (+),score=17.23 TRINITY_DN16333_c0_g1_i4:24-368(+)